MQWTSIFPGSNPGEWFPRPLPLTELPITRTIRVSDFGEALMLVRTPSASFMEIHQCESMILGNLELDYDPLPYTVGKVFAVDTAPGATSFDFEILDGCLLPDDPFFLSYLNQPRPGHGSLGQRPWGYFIDPNHPGRIKPRTSNVYFMDKIEPVSGRVYRYHVSREYGGSHLHGSEDGDIFNYLTRGGGAFVIRNSKQVTLCDATLYANGGANVQGTYNDCLNFPRVHIKIKDGRWRTSNADGFIIHSLAYAPWFESCTTEGMSDETINVHIRPHFIIGCHSRRQRKRLAGGPLWVQHSHP